MAGKLSGKRVSYDFATDTWTVDTRGLEAEAFAFAAEWVSDRTGIPIDYVKQTDKETGELVGYESVSASGAEGEYALKLIIVVAFGELAPEAVPMLRSAYMADAEAGLVATGDE